MNRFRWLRALALLLLLANLDCGGSTKIDDDGNDADSLSTYCRQTGVSCPQGPADVTPACDAVTSATTRTKTSCGSAITVTEGVGSQRYYFDAQDRLIGVGDANGGPHYGRACELEGLPLDLCTMTCQVGALEDFCSQGKECPPTADEVNVRCDFESTTYRYVNACGGVNFIVVVVGAIGWSFDADGRLIGAMGASDNAQYCDSQTVGRTYGKFCQPTDSGLDLCVPP